MSDYGASESIARDRFGMPRDAYRLTEEETLARFDTSREGLTADQVARHRAALRAVVAIEHTILIAVWHMLRNGEVYADPGADYYAPLDSQKAGNGALRNSMNSATRLRYPQSPPEVAFTP